MAVVKLQDLHAGHLQRICTVGVSGGGKSWLSRRLSAILDARYIQLDQLYWEPNWQEADAEVLKERLLAAMTGAEKWVIDGNYHSKTGPIKFPNATLVVWVAPSFPRTIYQAFGRAIQRICCDQEIWLGTGNRETFRRTFLSHDSILLWTLTSFRAIRARYLDLQTQSELPVVRIASPKQVDRLLVLAERISKEHSASAAAVLRGATEPDS